MCSQSPSSVPVQPQHITASAAVLGCPSPSAQSLSLSTAINHTSLLTTNPISMRAKTSPALQNHFSASLSPASTPVSAFICMTIEPLKTPRQRQLQRHVYDNTEEISNLKYGFICFKISHRSDRSSNNNKKHSLKLLQWF